MFRYKFPIINTIDDVLPAVKDREDFGVIDKGDFIYVHYGIIHNLAFEMTDENDLMGAIRRECRGIAFYPDGRIMSRPLQKFFNLNEKEETQSHKIDLSEKHYIYHKEDGSMLRPLDINGEIRWATKKGFSDVANMVDYFTKRNPKYNEFAKYCMERNLTPIFEYVGPNNRIIVDYKEENMILLAVRHNITGQYMDID